jgi:hypothetical protein
MEILSRLGVIDDSVTPIRLIDTDPDNTDYYEWNSMSHAVLVQPSGDARLLMAYPERLTGRCFPTTPPRKQTAAHTPSELTEAVVQPVGEMVIA